MQEPSLDLPSGAHNTQLQELDIPSDAQPTESHLISTRKIKIQIQRLSQISTVPFVIVPFIKGKQKATDVFYDRNYKSVLKEVVENGLNEDENLLFADSSDSKTPIVCLFIPTFNSFYSANQTSNWMEELLKKITDWKIKKVGICYTRSNIALSDIQKSMLKCLSAPCVEDVTLFDGDDNLNSSLNIAYHVKTKAEALGKSQVFVFH